MIQEALYARLQALAGASVHFGVAPKGTAAPFVVLTLVSGTHDWALAGATGARRYQVQVDCYASTLFAAQSLAGQVFDLLSPSGADFGTGPVTDLTGSYDETTGLHGARSEYQFHT